MSRRKVQYAKRNCIDPEEEGEELPFAPRDVVIHTDKWITDCYSLHEILGRGKFGEVKKCREQSTGLVLAAKMIATHKDSDRKSVRQEIELQSELRHPKILQIYDAFQRDKQMCIVMELIEGGELFDRVVDPKFDLTERVAILFMRQIVDAMVFIHSHNVLHLDMKPENIVCIAKTGTRIKIIDFGLAMRYDPSHGQQIMAGTVDFMAPEVANFEDVSPATDMWSVGVICYVLVSGLSPFQGDDDNETISDILRVEYDFAAEEFDAITAGCKDFIKKLLVRDPRKRLTAQECMKHSWLQNITRAQTNRHLSKVNHVKLFYRRKWSKAITAVKALNRLERMSVIYMNRKLSGATSEPARRRDEKQAASTTKQPEESHYDWRSHMEARRRQRNTDRDKSGNASTPPLVPDPRNGLRNGPQQESSSHPPPQRDGVRPRGRMDRMAALSQTPSNTKQSPASTAANHEPASTTANHLPANRRDRLAAVSQEPSKRTGSPVHSTPANRMDRLAAMSPNSSDKRPSSVRHNPEVTPAAATNHLPGRVNVRDRMNRFNNQPAAASSSESSHRGPPASRQGRLAAIASGK